MTSRPILMDAESVRAILAGRKTQTRRVVLPQFTHAVDFVRQNDTKEWCAYADGEPGIRRGWRRCPYGEPGQQMYVREPCLRFTGTTGLSGGLPWPTDADWRLTGDLDPWKALLHVATASPEHIESLRSSAAAVTVPSIHMPRWASRLTLEVVDVRVERLQAITEEDARAEGVDTAPEECSHRAAFARLWDRLAGRKPGRRWRDSPWVWVVTFRRIQ